jgi:hypothetical protein
MKILEKFFGIFKSHKKNVFIDPDGLYIINDLKKYLSDDEYLEIEYILSMENDVIRHVFIQDFFDDPVIHNKVAIIGDPLYIASKLSRNTHSDA